jgi:hypothetical protein
MRGKEEEMNIEKEEKFVERKKKRTQKRRRNKLLKKEETNVERMTEGTDILSDEKVLGPPFGS